MKVLIPLAFRNIPLVAVWANFIMASPEKKSRFSAWSAGWCWWVWGRNFLCGVWCWATAVEQLCALLGCPSGSFSLGEQALTGFLCLFYVFRCWRFWVAGFCSSKLVVYEAKKKSRELITLCFPWGPEVSSWSVYFSPLSESSYILKNI